MACPVRFAFFVALLTATTQAHTLSSAHHRLVSRQSSSNDACGAIVELVCTDPGIPTVDDDGRACADAFCTAVCLAAYPEIGPCCAQLTAASTDAWAACILALPDPDATTTSAVGGAATSLSISTSHGLGASSSSSAHHTSSSSSTPSTATTTTTAVLVSSSGGLGNTTTSAPSLTSPTISKSGASNTSATSTPTGNAAAGMDVAQAGILSSAMLWALCLIALSI